MRPVSLKLDSPERPTSPLVSDPPAMQQGPMGARRLGLPSAVALVVASMVGTGVFTTSGFALADLGSREAVLIAWVVGGGLAFLGALSYGALARRMPESGGEYHFLAQTVHPLAGFLAGWVSLLAGFTAPIAVAGLGLQAYLSPFLGHDLRPEWIGTAAIAIAALLHGLKLQCGVVLQNLAVGLKLLLIGGFVAMGLVRLPAMPPSLPAASTPFSVGAFAVSLVWISFSYCGWNAAVYVAGEIRDPKRNLGRSLLLGTGIVTFAYLALNTVFLYSAPMAALAGKAEIGAIAGEALGGEALRRGLTALISLALFTSISAMVMAGPRVYARMAQDGLFPRRLAAGRDVPSAAVALQALLAIGVVWVSELAALLGTIGFTLGLSSAATVCGLIALRRREGPERAPIPGYPWVPLAFVAGTLGASGFMVWREPHQAALGLVTVAAGVPLYAWMRRGAPQRSSPSRHRTSPPTSET